MASPGMTTWAYVPVGATYVDPSGHKWRKTGLEEASRLPYTIPVTNPSFECRVLTNPEDTDTVCQEIDKKIQELTALREMIREYPPRSKVLIEGSVLCINEGSVTVLLNRADGTDSLVSVAPGLISKAVSAGK